MLVILGRTNAEEAQETLPQGEFGGRFFSVLGTVTAGIAAVIAIGASAFVVAADFVCVKPDLSLCAVNSIRRIAGTFRCHEKSQE